MKYNIDDRINCRFGPGEIVNMRESINFAPHNLYQVKLDNPKYNGKLPWFAEHELKLESEVKRECEKEWRTRETLERITAKFEQEKAKGKVNPKILAGLMTEMERAFDIPLINNKDFNEKNKEVIELYRAISDSRGLLRENTKIKKKRKEIGRGMER